MMRNRKQDSNGGSADNALREQLLTHVYAPDHSPSSHLPTYSQAQQAEHIQAAPLPPHHAHNIDPAIAGPVPPAPSMMSHPPADSDPDGGSQADAKKAGGKRELSTSKRAAQNRAAQRAFRQRKEGHIKKLEEQVREYGAMMEDYKRMQNENYSLREYIIALQSRLLAAQGEIPPAPLNIDLQGPRDHAAPLPGGGSGAAATGQASQNAPAAPMNPSAASALQGIAKGASGQDVSMADRTDPALTAGSS